MGTMLRIIIQLKQSSSNDFFQEPQYCGFHKEKKIHKRRLKVKVLASDGAEKRMECTRNTMMQFGILGKGGIQTRKKKKQSLACHESILRIQHT